MHFDPSKKQTSEPDNEYHFITIGNKIYKKVTQTRFLGVIIDDKLAWTPHLQNLTKRLQFHIGSINRIKDKIPKSLHKSLYHTLFESHLLYGITVWGGVAQTNLEPIFNLQKKCLRILFGDNEAFKEKFRTSARSRPKDEQTLGVEFFAREESKPLFSGSEILTVFNAYLYHTTLETFKILKYRRPMCLYDLYTLSERKDTLLITSSIPSNVGFIFRSSTIWNIVRQKIKLTEFSEVKTSALKNCMKELIMKFQMDGDPRSWKGCEMDVTDCFKSTAKPEFYYGNLLDVDPK